jgi:hypothetical protein
MIAALGAAAFCVLSGALYALSRKGTTLRPRRAALRLLILGAAGLSLWPGCLTRDGGSQTAGGSEEPDGDDDGTASPALRKWARLGRIWRELTAHYKGERGDHQTGKAAFDKLKAEMTEALGALPAWPELSAVFEERWAHIDRSRYSMATCYKMMPGGIPAARHKVEEQVETLQQLVDEGKLTEDAALKASSVLAIQAEYMARNQEAEQAAEGEAGWEAVRKLWDAYNEGNIEAGAQAELAGKRLTELTVDKMGWLVGPPESAKQPPAATCYDMAVALPDEQE